jgi:hypothetical protein
MKWRTEQDPSGSIGVIIKYEEEGLARSFRYKNYSEYSASNFDQPSPKFNGKIFTENQPFSL